MRSLVAFSVLVIVGCSAAPQDAHEDAGLSIVPAEHDAGGADAMADAKADAHVEAAAPKPAPSCPNVPEDVSSFVPSSPKPARAFQSACGAGQVTSFYYACAASSASQYSCESWESASASNSTCAACMISNDTDAAWGPIVNHSDYAFVNQVGCAQRLNALTCASAAWEDQSCQMAACDGICDDDGLSELNACEANATAGGCKSYDDASTAACQTATGPFNKCFVADPQSQIVNVGVTFCGGS
jgi:hypothetical protein